MTQSFEDWPGMPEEGPCDPQCITCRGGSGYAAHRWFPQELTEAELDRYVKTGASVWRNKT